MDKSKADGYYILQDGTHADPADVTEVGGVWRHKNGQTVAMTADGKPQTVGDAAVHNMNVAAAEAGKPAADEPAPAPTPAPVQPTKAA